MENSKNTENGYVRTQAYLNDIFYALNKGMEYYKKVAPKIFLIHYPDSEIFQKNFKALKKL